MSRYDGLIIPRSYSEYINKTDAATLSQALQLSGVMDNAPTSGSNKPAKSGGIYETMGQVNRLTITVTTPFGTINVLQNGKVIQVSMNGAYDVSIPPGTELATLPKPAESLFIPVIKYNTQAVIGLLQLNSTGKLVAYSGNTQNLETAVYSFTYIAA